MLYDCCSVYNEVITRNWDVYVCTCMLCGGLCVLPLVLPSNKDFYNYADIIVG